MICVARCRCCFLAWLRVATAATRAGRDGLGRRDRLQHLAPDGDLRVTAQVPS